MKNMLPSCKLLCVLAVLSFSLNAGAQCYSFDDSIIPPGDVAHAFNIYGNGHQGFLQDWNVTSGTPSLEKTGSLGVTAYSGVQFGCTVACNSGATQAEGVSLHHAFQQGHTYRVTLATRTAPVTGGGNPLDINFILLQSPIAYTYSTSSGCSATPAIPQGAVVVDSIINYSQTAWSVKTITISNLTADYSDLWFRVSFTSDFSNTTAFCFDSVCVADITTNGDCYSFDDSIIPNGDVPHAFNIYGNGHQGFLQDWNVTSGTPSLEKTGSLGVTAYSGVQFACTVACNSGATQAEGVSLHKTFEPGHTYTLTLANRTAPVTGGGDPLDIKFILLQSPIAYTYSTSSGCSAIPATPQGALVVDSIIGDTSTAWTIKTITISNLSTTYTDLWFRVSFTSDFSNTTAFCFDSVCLTDQGTTLAVNDLTTAPAQPVLYQNNMNPFSSETTIRYYVPESGYTNAQIVVYDVTGKMVRQYFAKNAGNNSAVFEAGELGAGIYLYSLVVNGRRIDTKRMMLVK
ncbi:MAG TPA: T9SS type A sorting domain-containing protein [Chitinophagales bacterium]|nr:T9SS type A sorting domain-containing protein [Chitinophagales bacterium]